MKSMSNSQMKTNGIKMAIICHHQLFLTNTREEPSEIILTIMLLQETILPSLI